MRKLIVILALLALPSCMLGPRYSRPETTPPETWRLEYPAAAGAADLAWWTQFGDPVLDSLVQEAVLRNLELKAAAARVDQYLAVLGVTRSQYFPQVGYSGDGAIREKNGRDVDSYQAALGVSWEIDLWGRIRRQSEATQAQILAGEAGRRGALMTIVSSVAGGYINLRALDRQLEIARETEKAYGESVDLFRLRYQYGAISLIPLKQVESQYEQARQTVFSLEAAVRQQENLLCLLLGRTPGPIQRGRTIEELTVPPIPEGLPSTLLERRPDVIQAEQALVAANASIGAAMANYFPRISITGLLGVASTDLGDLIESESDLWSAGGSIVGPLLTFGAVSGQVDQAEASTREAAALYRQTVLNAFREVEDALIVTAKNRDRVGSLRTEVEALSEYARLARMQFEEGTADYLQVLDAERSLFSAQLAFTKGGGDTLISLITVYKTMGGGWIDEAQKLDPAFAPPEEPAHEEAPAAP